MKIELLPSTFERDGSAARRQHLTAMTVDDAIAFDAGSLATGCSDAQRAGIRDIVISHAHLDHIAGLPLFIDDLFSTLEGPIRVYASADVIGVLEEHIFNWSVYPRFSELRNDFGPVMAYCEFSPGEEFAVRHCSVLPIQVNHKVPSCGFIIKDETSTIASTGDTAPTEIFWDIVNGLDSLDAVLVECAFPDELAELAEISHHLTPRALANELGKLERNDCEIYISNIKPTYRDLTVSQIERLGIDRLKLLEIAREYVWPRSGRPAG
ncbi:MAG: 3',5'-cyclic-nucleotide phosphodiesterase [Acidobacteria bacterium]|nr:3',5'-cyclic-nucleotide phosphodiesterase [Acidobacteriota bacterium]